MKEPHRCTTHGPLVVPKTGNVVYSFRGIGNSDDISVWTSFGRTGSQFPHPARPDAPSLSSRRRISSPAAESEKGRGSFSNEPPAFTLFPAASAEARPRLPVWNLPEINTGARARRLEPSRREYTRRDKVSRRRDASASLATFKLPKPVRSFLARVLPSPSRPIPSWRFNPRRLRRCSRG